jgi:hypothetical protein
VYGSKTEIENVCVCVWLKDRDIKCVCEVGVLNLNQAESKAGAKGENNVCIN